MELVYMKSVTENKINSKCLFRSTLIIGCLITLFSVFPSCSMAAGYDNYKTGDKLLTTMTFVPHVSFGATSVQHFNHALYEWNAAAGWSLMSREPIIKHSSSFYPSEDGNNYIYKTNAGSQYLAETTWWTYGNGITHEADININPYYAWANTPQSGYHDVWTVFLHEAGHVAGLSDNYDHPDSVMYYQGAAGESKRYLTNFDRAVLSSIY